MLTWFHINYKQTKFRHIPPIIIYIIRFNCLTDRDIDIHRYRHTLITDMQTKIQPYIHMLGKYSISHTSLSKEHMLRLVVYIPLLPLKSRGEPPAVPLLSGAIKSPLTTSTVDMGFNLRGIC